jgi:hypothetical protein
MPRYQKGQSGNPKGRPAGTPNKTTGSIRDRISQLLEDHFDQVAEDLKSMDPKDRTQAWMRLLEYVVPKLRQQDLQVDAKEMPQITPISFRWYDDDTELRVEFNDDDDATSKRKVTPGAGGSRR